MTLLTLYRHEVVAHLRSWRFYVMLAVGILLGLLTLLVRYDLYAKRLGGYQATLAEQEERLRENFSLSWPEYFVYKPPALLSIVSEGMPWEGAFDGFSYSVTVKEDPLERLFAWTDLLWIVGVVMGLFSLLLTFDTISSERETGTLFSLLSYPLRPSTLILGKWAAGMTMIVFVLIVISLEVVAFLMCQTVSGFGWQEIVALSITFLASISYVSALCFLGVAISARVRSSLVSLWTCLVFWLLFVFLIPSLSPDVARLILASPSQVDYLVYRSRVKYQLRGSMLRELEAYQRVARDGGDTRPLLHALVARDGIVIPALERIRMQVGKVEADLARKADREVRLTRCLAASSPYACLVFIGSDISDTGVYSQGEFAKRARAWISRFLEWFYVLSAGIDESGDIRRVEEPLDTSTLPRFTYEDTRLADRLWVVMPFLLVMFLYNALFYSVACGLFARHPREI